MNTPNPRLQDIVDDHTRNQHKAAQLAAELSILNDIIEGKEKELKGLLIVIQDMGEKLESGYYN